jgi:ubiquinone biosynthesis protein
LNFVKKIQDDDYSIGVEVTNAEKILNKIEAMINRVSFSIILLALSIIITGVIIGNSLSAGAEMSGLNKTIQILGLILSIVIVIGIVISMYRSHKK